MRFIITLLLLSSPAHAGFRCETLLLKMQNQYHHVKKGRFVWMRTLHQLLRNAPTTRKWVYLWQLRPLHAIDYPIALRKKKEERRREILDMFYDELLERGLSIEVQNDLLPSTKPIQMLSVGGMAIVKDGNGRLNDLLWTFGLDDLPVEVEKIQTKNPIVPYLVHKTREANELE